MRFYLSSFKFGNQKHRLRELAPSKRIAIIPNALDFRDADDEQTRKSLANKVLRLTELGFEPEVIDLKDYLGKQKQLRNVIDAISAVFVLGGNVFVLRQAMKLSGLDEIILGHKDDPNFLYAGYSAAGCVLAPSLEPYRATDDIAQTPYAGQDVITDGLGLVDFAFMPHWDSDHPESKRIREIIEYCKRKGIVYQAIHDGEVLIF